MKSSRIFSKFSIIAGVLALLLSACAPGAATQAGPDLSGTQAALEATQSALQAQQTEAAKPAEAGPTEAPTPQPAATAEPTAEPTEAAPEDEAYYTEEFSVPPLSWSFFLLSGDDADFDLYTQSDRLIFDISGQNVWPYYSYDSYTYFDVRLDARAENLGNNNNNVTLFCRMNDRGWYEFNVANNGLYNIFRYEIQTDKFTALYTGGVQNLRTGKDTNDYTVICKGDRLTLGVNGDEIRTVRDSFFDSGYAGISVASFSGVPVRVEFDYVTISEP